VQRIQLDYCTKCNVLSKSVKSLVSFEDDNRHHTTIRKKVLSSKFYLSLLISLVHFKLHKIIYLRKKKKTGGQVFSP